MNAKWALEYKSKAATADRALEEVRSGQRVWIQPGCSTPLPLVEALVRRAPYLRNVECAHMLTLGPAEYTSPEFDGIFRANGLFLGGNMRPAVQAGRADYVPIFLSEIENLIRSGQLPIDVALVQVSRPDSHGYMSFGTGVDCSLTAAQHAPVVIAEVNDRMPRTFGDCFLHLTQVTHVVETSRPLLELEVPPYGEVHRRIAANVAGLIPDGATLQLGIGEIPDAVLSCLENHKDLGIHSEMISDGVIPLIESGVISCMRKTLHPGKAVIAFVLGTKKLFDFLDNDPFFELHPVYHVNDPFVIAQNERMVAINSAIQVDLSGQVCSDSIGHKPYSGFGGQTDFIRGAARSKGGKPIIALPSTARDGAVSRIAPVLTPGSGVVTGRADVHYVATEHGVAYLHGKNLRQRAEALIGIAGPKFRDDLYDFAYRAKILRPAGVLAG
jgi:acyl-CoA hydrolase